jgi:hypothetical protein
MSTQRVDGARLPAVYDHAYASMLTEVGATPGVEPNELTGFWPMIGHSYTGKLMVIGRAVNGWIDKITLEELRTPGRPEAVASLMRQTGEGDGSCPMGWVVWRWGLRGGYSTARSAYWRFVRRSLAAVDPESVDDPAWSSRLVWSNLAKIAPWAGGNPGGRLLEVQRRLGPELLRLEIEACQPQVVLVLAGRWWSEPFTDALGLDVAWRDGLLEGVADDRARRWIIGPHPQGKPRALWDEVAAVLDRAH